MSENDTPAEGWGPAPEGSPWQSPAGAHWQQPASEYPDPQQQAAAGNQPGTEGQPGAGYSGFDPTGAPYAGSPYQAIPEYRAPEYQATDYNGPEYSAPGYQPGSEQGGYWAGTAAPSSAGASPYQSTGGSPPSWNPASPPPPYPPAGSFGADASQPADPPPSSRRRRALPVLLSAALVFAGGAAGVAIGHNAWSSNHATNVAASSTSPTTSGGSGSGNTGSGNTGSGNTGSGNTGSGNSGSGNSGSGQSPFSNGQFPGNLFGGSGGSTDPFSGGSSGSNGSGNSSSGNTGSGNSSSGTGASAAEAAAIAAKVAPALVDINATFGYQSAQGAGTGIVLTSNGEVLTNNHVVDGATKLSVTDVGNGQTYNATVVGYDASHDVAVVQLQNASGLKTAKLANSDNTAVGESVVAIGNAGGTGGTPSNAGGSITALNQSITASDELDGNSEQLSGLIQTNADIQPGDSGGSLVDTSGQVVGMDTAASQGYSFQSSTDNGGTQGFAIPINQAMSVVHQIVSGQGSATAHVGPTAFLGLLLGSSSDQGGSGGLGAFGNGSASGGSGSSGTSGLTISSVVSGGPAAGAGLSAGDVITSLDGQSVSSPSDLSSILVSHHPGDKVQVGWVDSSGQSHTTTVDLGSGPPA